jgi:cytochrome c553
VTWSQWIPKKADPALIQVKIFIFRGGHCGRAAGEVAGMRITLFLTLVLGIVFPLGAKAADSAGSLDPQLIAKCQECHAPGGSQSTPATPRLNGQDAGYLFRRLNEFLDPTSGTPRATEHMWETATKLGDRTASQLARFFADQPVTPADPKIPLATRGAKIYRLGILGDVPACQSCHGPAGEGREAAPRLAGQRGDYLEEQLSAFMLQMRVSSAMNRHAWHMEPDQFRALRAYLSNDQ